MANATPLHEASCKGDLDDVDRMRVRLLSDPASLERPQDPPQFCGTLSPLQSAVHVGHEVCARFLIESGARVDARNERGYTALYVATYAFEPTLVSLLLRHGASPNYLTPDGITADQIGHSRNWYLYLACSFGFLDIARSLAQHGAAPEEFWSTGYSSSAQVSALKNHPECLLLALKYGAVTDFNKMPAAMKYENLRYYSLLHFSIQGKSFQTHDSVLKVNQIWNILRQFGANFWFRDAKNRTVLERLSRKEYPENHAKLLVANLKEVISEPVSLQSLCRLEIKRCMGSSYNKNVVKLRNLPPALKGFLQFDDLE